MKILSLNLWGGRQGKALFDYLRDESRSVDIFCFQEVFDSTSKVGEFHGARPSLLTELEALLPDFQANFARAYTSWVDMEKVDFNVSEGQAVFVKNNCRVFKSGFFYIYGKKTDQIADNFENEPKIMQWVEVAAAGQRLLIANAHGKWYPGTKLDSPERLQQSDKIIKFLKTFQGPKVLCGDFNLMPQTQSIKILELELRNLISQFNIQNTRNEISWKHYGNKQYFADYTFVSPEINVASFQVPYSEVSDHLPMILEFEVNGRK